MFKRKVIDDNLDCNIKFLYVSATTKKLRVRPHPLHLFVIIGNIKDHDATSMIKAAYTIVHNIKDCDAT
jgi:hypothetical protein